MTMDMPDKIWVCKDISDHGSNYIATPNANETVKLLRTPYVRQDLAQSLADALEVVASWSIPDDPMFKSETAQKIYIGQVARAALANYRKGE